MMWRYLGRKRILFLALSFLFLALLCPRRLASQETGVTVSPENWNSFVLTTSGLREVFDRQTKELKTWKDSFEKLNQQIQSLEKQSTDLRLQSDTLREQLTKSSGAASSLRTQLSGAISLSESLNESLQKRASEISRLEKSRNFWRTFALAGIPAAAGAGLLAGLMIKK
jgi:septal ring factor EnvC (AmiA/AmiB activator)